MRIFILIILLACKSPVAYTDSREMAPIDTAVAPIGDPPGFPDIGEAK